MTAMAESVKTHCLIDSAINSAPMPKAWSADNPPRIAIHLGGGASGSSSLRHFMTALISMTMPTTNSNVEVMRLEPLSPYASAAVPKT